MAPPPCLPISLHHHPFQHSTVAARVASVRDATTFRHILPADPDPDADGSLPTTTKMRRSRSSPTLKTKQRTTHSSSLSIKKLSTLSSTNVKMPYPGPNSCAGRRGIKGARRRFVVCSSVPVLKPCSNWLVSMVSRLSASRFYSCTHSFIACANGRLPQ
jgi:hypothetical protein